MCPDWYPSRYSGDFSLDSEFRIWNCEFRNDGNAVLRIGNSKFEIRNRAVKMRFVETPLRVRYSETDRMGIVYHTNYIVWFEIGRTEYCRAAGLPYRSMEDAGLLILVTAVECRYRRPARYDDALRVRASMTELASRGLAFGYEIVDSAETVLADGITRHVFADMQGRPRRASPDVLTIFERFREG